LLGLFTEDQARFQRKVKLILLPGIPDDAVPTNLNGVPRFRITQLTPDGLEDLLRTLTGQPVYEPAPLGEMPVYPTASAAGRVDEAVKASTDRADDEDLDRQLARIDEEIGVLRVTIARLPELQPWEGPPFRGGGLGSARREDCSSSSNDSG
jgi:hypothetical protein